MVMMMKHISCPIIFTASICFVCQRGEILIEIQARGESALSNIWAQRGSIKQNIATLAKLLAAVKLRGAIRKNKLQKLEDALGI